MKPLSRSILLSLGILAVTAASGPRAAAGERSMGDGKAGEMQDLNSWNNDAAKFAEDSGTWKRRFNPKTVGRPSGQSSVEKTIYCLSEARKGAQMLKEGNAMSQRYEAYLAAHGNDSAVKAAYDAHGRNLREFYKHVIQTDESAHCR